jgi:hypothetical protein
MSSDAAISPPLVTVPGTPMSSSRGGSIPWSNALVPMDRSDDGLKEPKEMARTQYRANQEECCAYDAPRIPSWSSDENQRSPSKRYPVAIRYWLHCIEIRLLWSNTSTYSAQYSAVIELELWHIMLCKDSDPALGIIRLNDYVHSHSVGRMICR